METNNLGRESYRNNQSNTTNQNSLFGNPLSNQRTSNQGGLFGYLTGNTSQPQSYGFFNNSTNSQTIGMFNTENSNQTAQPKSEGLFNVNNIVQPQPGGMSSQSNTTQASQNQTGGLLSSATINQPQSNESILSQCTQSNSLCIPNQSSNTCSTCSQVIQKDPNIFSCNHSVCSNCIYKNVMHNCRSILIDNLSYTELELECLVCKTGKLKSTLKNISEILERSQDAKEENHEICPLHKKTIESYCLDCKWKLCCDCLEMHQIIPAFTDHIVTCDIKLSRINKTCFKHKISYESAFYCTTCNQPACPMCIENDHNIYNDDMSHRLQYIKSHYKNIEAEIQSKKMPFDNYEDFNQYLEKESLQVLEQLNTHSTKMNDTIQRISQSLHDFREDFNNKIEILQTDFKIKLSLIKCIVKKFYMDLNLLVKEDYVTLDIISNFQKNFKKFCYTITNDYNVHESFNDFEKKLNLEKLHCFRLETLVENAQGSFKKMENNSIPQCSPNNTIQQRNDNPFGVSSNIGNSTNAIFGCSGNNYSVMGSLTFSTVKNSNFYS
jgi:hypothetical protein